MQRNNTEKPEALNDGPMNYAPENEMGVVFLFAHLAKRWRLRIEEIRRDYPDCIAYCRTSDGQKRARIEFEYKSRNFRTQGHDPTKCDWLVCWEHNWPDAPKRLNVVELRREYGLGFNVWLMPVKKEYQDELDDYPRGEWSAPGQAHKDDLILFYFSGRGRGFIKYVYKCGNRASFTKSAGWKKGTTDWKRKSDYRAYIHRICGLHAPIFLTDLQMHRVLRTAGFVRGDLRGRLNITEYWPYLYDLIAKRNRTLKSRLRKYAPELLP